MLDAIHIFAKLSIAELILGVLCILLTSLVVLFSRSRRELIIAMRDAILREQKRVNATRSTADNVIDLLQHQIRYSHRLVRGLANAIADARLKTSVKIDRDAYERHPLHAFMMARSEGCVLVMDGDSVYATLIVSEPYAQVEENSKPGVENENEGGART